ncbi:class I SAM-dependent methyltransferase [bacterium]|nr:class I SAM-dependent methyltransferase [bacterium]MBU1071932.1 class I SAM-dependent methyltransferase [bacterium]MBU1676993.1 class I SAM-dependent methyltransferase [bacterium]
MYDHDAAYAGYATCFGDRPEAILTASMGEIAPGGRVLDIGVGQGRNALPLARAGLRVTGIDPSAAAIEQVRDKAVAAGQEIALWRGEFGAYEPEAPFDAVLCFGLLQVLSRSQCASLIHRLHAWTEIGSLLMLTAWHVDDPSYERISDTWEKVGLHSFRNERGEHRTYLARGVIRNLIPGWEVLHHEEILGPVHGHGDGEEHRHGVIELVARRR